MKAIMAIYLAIVLFMGIAQDVGYTGVAYSNVTTVNDIGEEAAKYRTIGNSTDTAKATLGVFGSFLEISLKGLFFSYTIDGAPDVVNYAVAFIFGILSWFFYYDFMVLVVGALSGVLGRVL